MLRESDGSIFTGADEGQAQKEGKEKRTSQKGQSASLRDLETVHGWRTAVEDVLLAIRPNNRRAETQILSHSALGFIEQNPRTAHSVTNLHIG
jgi:hypothetical protein